MNDSTIEKEYLNHRAKFRYRAAMYSKMDDIPEEEYHSIYNETIVKVARGELRTAKFSSVLHSALINAENKLRRDIREKMKRDVTEEMKFHYEADTIFSYYDMLRWQDYPPDTEEIAIRNKEKDDLRQQIVALHANVGSFQNKLLLLLREDRFYNRNTERLNKSALAKELSCSRDRIDAGIKKLKTAAIKQGIAFPGAS